jgi:hypothetical protein
MKSKRTVQVAKYLLTLGRKHLACKHGWRWELFVVSLLVVLAGCTPLC